MRILITALGGITTTLSTLTAALFLTGSAYGLVLDAKTPQQKHRRDIGKQTAKYLKCLEKAREKCSRRGADDVPLPCSLVSGDVGGDDPDLEAKFQANLEKCKSKLDFMKRAPEGANTTSAAIALGCPAGTDDMDEYEQQVKVSVPATLDSTFVEEVEAFFGACSPFDDKLVRCYSREMKRFHKFRQGLRKCQEKCENDYKDKRGNGGTTDSSTNCSAGGRCSFSRTTCLYDLDCPGSESCSYNFSAVFEAEGFRLCLDKVFGKARKKSSFSSSFESDLPWIVQQVNEANDTLYNSPNSCP